MNFEAFRWINRSEAVMGAGKLRILAPAKTDRFNAPQGAIASNAPFFYRAVSGDFVLRARVSMDGRDDYDGAGLLAMSDNDHWVKTCLENTDFGTVAVVSVVTNGVSDDANGPNIGQDHVWLKIARKGGLFAVHYSLDGKRFDMVRVCTIPVGESEKAGFVAQAPVGAGGCRWFEEAVLEQRAVEDIRKGR